MITLPRMHLLRTLVVGIVVALAPFPTPVAADDDTFAERFDAASNRRWTVGSSNTRSTGIRLATADQPPGLYFLTQGSSYAYAPWAVGTRPFEFSFEIEIERGNQAAWRWPGVGVALCSAPPDKMTDDDLSLICSVHQQGVMASVHTGPFFDAFELRPNVWRFTGRDPSPRYVLNQNGAGGHNYSIQWPSKKLDGTRIRCRVVRRPDNVVAFEVFYTPDDRRPWWTGQWQLPEQLAAVPLRYVAIKTVLNSESYRDLNEPIRTVDELEGRVGNLQGRTLDGPPRPVVTRFTADDASLQNGSNITLLGKQFEDGAKVFVDGKPLPRAERLGDDRLRVALAHLPGDGPAQLEVVNPSGLSARLPGGIPVGRVVDRIEPREVSPAGGDEVTLVGGGFDRSTQVTVNGQPAATLELIDSTRLCVRVPAGQAGLAEVEVTTGEETFRGSPALAYAPHPYLWYRADEFDDLKKKFNEPLMADYKRLIVDTADGPPEKIGKLGAPNHSNLIHAYLWAYLMTGEPSYRARLTAAVDALLVGTDDLPGNDFGHPGQQRKIVSVDEFMCHNAEAIATVYDTLFDELSPGRKTAMLRYLDRNLQYYLGRLRANDWWYRNNPSNTIAVGNGCGGIVALALHYGTPEAQEAVDQAVETIRDRYVAMADDGGCIEGNLYWDYGLTHQLLFGHALRNATGDDRGLLTQPKVLKAHRFVETQLAGDGRYFTFNDTQPWLTGLAICADVGSRFDQPLLRWMADKTAHEAAAGTTRVFTRPQFYALAFRCRDRQPAPKQLPELPTTSYLEVLNWGVMRSEGTEFLPKLVVGVKGRDGQTTHHAQEDLGSFVLHSRGEGFLIDPGYYQPKATAHSLPLVDGAGPDAKATALITDAWQAVPWRTMTVDATAAYKTSTPERVRRVIVMAGDAAVILLDEIAPGKARTVTCQYQCGFPAALQSDGRSAILTGKQSRLALRTFGPALQLAAEGPLDFERSWVFAESDVAWHRVTGDYRPDPADPLVTVLLPCDATGEVPEVHLKRTGTTISVTLPKYGAVVFEKAEQGWGYLRPVGD